MNRPTVVFLHGLLRTERSMARLRAHVERAGYATWACTYPSRRVPIRACGAYVAERLAGAGGVSGPLFAVTHSLGALVVRETPELPWAGAVMLAPPNRGSQVARRMRNNPLYRWLYGPAGQEVAAVDAWPQPRFPCGVIAGTRAVSVGNPTSWVSGPARLLDGPSDGTVAVDETHLDVPHAFATVDANHTWIMDHPEVTRRVLRFLAARTFEGA